MWCGSVVDRVLRGRRLDSLHVTTLGKLFTHNVPLFIKQYKLVPAIGWEGNRLTSHWPCVTDSVVYPPTGSMAWEMETSTPPKLHLEYYGIFTVPNSHPTLTMIMIT